MNVAGFVGRYQKRSHWSKSITTFAFVPGATSFQLKFSFRNIIMHTVTCYIICRLFRRNISCFFADNHGELHFPIRFYGILWNHYRVIRAGKRSITFHENNRFFWYISTCFSGVVGIIQTNADYF